MHNQSNLLFETTLNVDFSGTNQFSQKGTGASL